MDNVRELVLDMLMEILEKGSYSHLVIRNVLDKYDYCEYRDKAFVKRLTEGTLERLIQIDYILNQFSKVPVSKMKPLIRNLMRMSVYQILFMDTVPDSAICNEAVKLAGKRGFKGLQGFCNGVLRNISRNKDKIVYPNKNKNVAEALSVRFSMPLWLVDMWLAQYGEEKTEEILTALLQVHPVTLRLRENLSEEQRQQWIKAMEEKHFKISQHAYLPYAFLLEEAEGLRQLPGYEEGLFTVQDVSSMLVAEAAGLAGNEQVMDVCAAPGGKAMHAAEKLKDGGRVLARDLSEYKVSLIRDNSNRMGYKNLEMQVYDSGVLDESMIEQANVVFADLPCSGLGILGKKRDIKYRITPETLTELEELQRNLLNVIWQYVKPDGVLIYSTCTINPGENQGMVKWFTDNYPFELESLSPFLPESLRLEGKSGMLQLLPGIHETDGFFLARLRRKA